jgi:hypothetical protein
MLAKANPTTPLQSSQPTKRLKTEPKMQVQQKKLPKRPMHQHQRTMPRKLQRKRQQRQTPQAEQQRQIKPRQPRQKQPPSATLAKQQDRMEITETVHLQVVRVDQWEQQATEMDLPLPPTMDQQLGARHQRRMVQRLKIQLPKHHQGLRTRRRTQTKTERRVPVTVPPPPLEVARIRLREWEVRLLQLTYPCQQT